MTTDRQTDRHSCRGLPFGDGLIRITFCQYLSLLALTVIAWWRFKYCRVTPSFCNLINSNIVYKTSLITQNLLITCTALYSTSLYSVYNEKVIVSWVWNGGNLDFVTSVRLHVHCITLHCPEHTIVYCTELHWIKLNNLHYNDNYRSVAYCHHLYRYELNKCDLQWTVWDFIYFVWASMH